MKTKKHPNGFWNAIALTCALIFAAGFSQLAVAQMMNSTVAGTVLDPEGNPYAGVVVSLKGQTGQVLDVTTDSAGKYTRPNVVPGPYTVTLMVKDQPIYRVAVNVPQGQTVSLNINLKDVREGKAPGEDLDAAKRAEANKAAFAAMKGHFDAGLAALDQERQMRAQMDKLPKAQQPTMQPQLDQISTTAITELQGALAGTAETDSNRSIILGRLGEAYEGDGKYPEAADAYQKAVAIKPEAGYYNNLGNSLARSGKVDDALTAYQKAIELDPPNTAVYWRNFAIGLYNTGRIKESVDPLRKATAADPKNAQAWYLLGAALVNTMEFKQEGDKMVPVMQPGTMEAYQQAIDLDPTGTFGEQAKQGMEALQAMGVGISTQVNQGGKAPAKKKQP